MEEFKKIVEDILKKEISEDDIILESPPNNSMGDLAFPCFKLSKTFKKSPNDIAKELLEKLEPTSEIKRIDAEGPYLNFFFDEKWIAKKILIRINEQKEDFGKPHNSPSKIKKQENDQINENDKNEEKILIEYPSPNTNKPLHLGHLRNIVLGNTLVKLLRSSGKNIITANLLNDRGIHICKSMLAYEKWGKLQEPDKKEDHFVGDFYVKFAQESEKDPSLEKEAQDLLKKWEEGDPETIKLWKLMNSWAERGFKKTLKEFDYRCDKEYKESEFYDEAKEILSGIEDGERFYRDEKGNLVCKLEDYGLPDKIVLRHDGTSIYMTQDIKLAQMKFEEFQPDKLIYLTGSEQNLHFRQLFKILDILNLCDVKNCQHLNYGMIYLPEGKMKSRQGTVVDADNLLEEMKQMAKTSIIQRTPYIKQEDLNFRVEAIAKAAIRFYILKFDPSRDITYNPSESISFEGETGPYLQYTHARICSILRKDGGTYFDVDFGMISNKMEKELVLMLSKFDSFVEESIKNLRPSTLCRYLLDLAQKFNEYYHSYRVLDVEEELKNARLLLLDCIRQVLNNGLEYLDITALNEM